MKKYILFLTCSLLAATAYANRYTVLDANQYHETVNAARIKITHILTLLNTKPTLDANAKIAFIASQLADIPYLHQNGMGEGDWQPASSVYQPDAIHIKQNPVYRMDGLNCQTLVQVAMALYLSRNLSVFDKHYLKIAYGAAGNPDGNIVRFYNRNNFIDADFNPVNQRNGWLTDVTSSSPYAKQIHATITRQQWFLRQRYHLAGNIEVLADASGPLMLARFNTVYTALNFPHFVSENMTMSYLPKELLAIRQKDDRERAQNNVYNSFCYRSQNTFPFQVLLKRTPVGFHYNKKSCKRYFAHVPHFKPNQRLLDKIPTPAILEIVRDPNRWNDDGIKIKDILGTQETVSHLGLLYRQTFTHGELIYQKTTCELNDQRKKVCEVTPVICQKKICKELMFTHATNAYPKKYYWYQAYDGKYVCSPSQPASNTPYTSCNRVVSLPFYDYLTDYQLGYYWNMDVPSILGVHIEKLGKLQTLS